MKAAIYTSEELMTFAAELKVWTGQFQTAQEAWDACEEGKLMFFMRMRDKASAREALNALKREVNCSTECLNAGYLIGYHIEKLPKQMQDNSDALQAWMRGELTNEEIDKRIKGFGKYTVGRDLAWECSGEDFDTAMSDEANRVQADIVRKYYPEPPTFFVQCIANN
jgi:hypothetical protein